MDSFKFKKIEDKYVWNNLLNEFWDSNIYHTWNYAKEVQYEKHIEHIALYNSNDLISLFQIRIRKLPGINSGIAYIFKGPIWQRKNVTNNLAELLYILTAIRKEYSFKHNLLLRIRPFIYSDQFSNSEFQLEVSKIFKIKPPIYRTLVLDLTRDIIDIRRNFRQNWRNHLNKAEKNDIIIKKGTTNDLFNDFINIYDQMIERKKFKENVDIKAVMRLNELLENSHKLKIITAYKENIPVSGIIFSSLGDIGISLFRATNKMGMKLNASYLIQYETLKWLKDLESKKYDLGGIDIENNPHVYNFKVGITTNELSDLGNIEYSRSLLSQILVFIGEHLTKLLK